MTFQIGNKIINTGRTRFKKGYKPTLETIKKLRESSIKLGSKPPSPLGIKRSPENCKNISNGLKGNTNARGAIRSKETIEKLRLVKGERHHNWQGGITELNDQIRSCFKMRQWVSDVFTKDKFICQDCNIKGGNGIFIEAHHIKAFSVILKEYNIKTLEEALSCEELWNINNGKTLCHECHKKTDNYGGKQK